MKTLLLLWIFAGLVGPAFGQSSAEPTSVEDGFVHTVFFWLENPDSEADRAELLRGLRTLPAIPTIRHAHIGVPAPAARGVIDDTYDFSLTFIFDDQAGEQAYQVHPVHEAFVENYAHLWGRVVVYDAVPAGR